MKRGATGKVRVTVKDEVSSAQVIFKQKKLPNSMPIGNPNVDIDGSVIMITLSPEDTAKFLGDTPFYMDLCITNADGEVLETPIYELFMKQSLFN